MTTLLLAMAVVAALWAVGAAMLTAAELQRRQHRIHWLFLSAMTPSYLHRYRQITTLESGRAGPLFYHFVIPINVALVCVLIVLLFAIGR